MSDLISTSSLVESPFIVATIGGFTFGSVTKNSISSNIFGKTLTFPNFMKSLSIVKVNGEVNTYTLQLEYGVTQFDDPNIIDKVFSTAMKDRKITLTYGDWQSPDDVYREENAIITAVTSDMDFKSSKINYTITCTSTALKLSANRYSFPKREAQPSSVLQELYNNKRYGLSEVFTGMTSEINAFNKYVARDDSIVTIEAQPNTTILEYMTYLTKCMQSTDKNSKINAYMLSFNDDVHNTTGPYFSVKKIEADTVVDSPDTKSIDVGYPGSNLVTNFTVNNHDAWNILYEYSSQVNESNYIYRIDNKGKMITEYSPSIASSKQLMRTTAEASAWWQHVTRFPITCTLTIKGLVKPAIIATKVRVNVYFYGKKHISSGLYTIIKQEDTLDSSGYRTNLTLLRTGEDNG